VWAKTSPDVRFVRKNHFDRSAEGRREIVFGAGSVSVDCVAEGMHCTLYRAGIFKRLWSPGIDAKASVPPAYVAWRAGTITLFLLGA
jgi:hypothetical protein